jgi:hypothetical protein
MTEEQKTALNLERNENKERETLRHTLLLERSFSDAEPKT